MHEDRVDVDEHGAGMLVRDAARADDLMEPRMRLAVATIAVLFAVIVVLVIVLVW